VAMWRKRRRPESDMDADTLRCGPLAAAVLSTVTLNSLLAGLSVRTADALGRGVAIGSPTPGDPAPAIWYPRVYDLFAVGFVAGLLLVLALLAVAWLTTGRDEPTSGIAAEYDDDQAAEDAILSALPSAPGAGGRNDLERSQRRWLDGIRFRRRLAELVTRIDWACWRCRWSRWPWPSSASSPTSSATPSACPTASGGAGCRPPAPGW